ncbi:MAG: hypothetical protein EBZ48_08070 [Proteobacteria bacterium]|nr:hypothetical protein [Pseudomonadota bacterium]
MNEYTADYCRAVLNKDEKWQLDSYLESMRRYSLFGISFDTTADLYARRPFQPILEEELQADCVRLDMHLEPWRNTSINGHSRFSSIRRCWELLGIESGEARLRFFLEHGKEHSGIGLLESCITALLYFTPSESDITAIRFNPWCRSLVERWIAQQHRETVSQAAG